MLGLAVLFFLGLWVLITLFAMWIGYKLFKKLWQKFYVGLLGAFLGFMLTMGGLIVYWTIEYYQIKSTVTHLCETEGGIKVYVTPEEWRKQIGEEEWTTLKSIQEVIPISQKQTILFNGKQYTSSIIVNPRIYYFLPKSNSIREYIGIYDAIYYDIKNKKVLFQEKSFFSGTPPIGFSLSGLKFWLNNIEDCNSSTFPEELRFYSRKYTNFNTTAE